MKPKLHLKAVGKVPNFGKEEVSRAKHVGQPNIPLGKKKKLFKMPFRMLRGTKI